MFYDRARFPPCGSMRQGRAFLEVERRKDHFVKFMKGDMRSRKSLKK